MDSTQQTLQQTTEDQLTLRSGKFTHISALTALLRSLLFAELSMIAYLHPVQVKKAALKLGFKEAELIDNDGSQAYSFSNDTDIVIACRGTEATEWNDLKADINAAHDFAETVGRVHRGFKKEVDDLWPVLEKMLKTNSKKLWFTGHSLGGAMATICASRCLLSHINSIPEQVQTFGSPRVGNKRYINNAKINYLRWVNNNDIVTRSPPVWMGYRHTGIEMYLDSEGRLKKLNPIQRSQDRWKGFIAGLKNKEIDHLTDHSIIQYVEYIYNEAVAAGEFKTE